MKPRFCLILLLLLATSCGKDEQGEIPYVPVNRELYASDPEFNNLNVVGGWVYLTGGSRGLLIYRRTNDEFVAYDRHCTYNPEDPCGQVKVESAGAFTAVDTCCGSKFLIADGSVQNGPAQWPLKIYQTSFDGVKLMIFN